MQQTSARCGILRAGVRFVTKILPRRRRGRRENQRQKPYYRGHRERSKHRLSPRLARTTPRLRQIRPIALRGLGQAAGEGLVEELFHLARGFLGGCFLLLAKLTLSLAQFALLFAQLALLFAQGALLLA